MVSCVRSHSDWYQERAACPGQDGIQTGQEGGQGHRRPQAADVSAIVEHNDQQADDTDAMIDSKL